MSRPAGNADGVDRTLRILSLVAEQGPLSLTDISDATELPRATTLRFLRGIAAAGYVQQLDDKQWMPTAKVWRLGLTVAERSHDLSKQLEKVLADVALATGESAVYSHYEGGWVFYLAYSPSPEQVRTHATLGERHHASEVNSGRATFAFRPESEIDESMREFWGAERWEADEGDAMRLLLSEIAADGFAFSANTNKPDMWKDIWGVAVPVFSGQGPAVGALAITGPKYRTPNDPEALAEVIVAARSSLIVP